MPKQPLVDRLEDAVQQMLTRTAGRLGAARDAAADSDVAPLLGIAEALRNLPHPRFRARLKADLDKVDLEHLEDSDLEDSDLEDSERTPAMTTSAESIAAASQTATPQMRVRNAAAAIEFYKNAFGARELMRFAGHGQIAHARLAIGNSIIMVSEEAPDYGFPGPEALGGSPVGMHLYVDDADALAERAVAAGARLVSPVADQFYGDRSGQIADPFGYGWTIATRKEDLSVEEMHRRFEALEAQAAHGASTFIPEGFHTVTPYLVVEDVPAQIEFLTRVFGAEERHRSSGSGGGIHAEVKIGDSMLMVGGGAGRPAQPTALHVYVEDTDAVYQRALAAGAISIGVPVDQEYGERSGGVRDRSGNVWYIATFKSGHYIPPGLHAVNVYLHPLRAEPLIKFLERAFGASGVRKYASPDGVINHASVNIGDSPIEMGEAHGPYQPMPTMFYLYVPNVEAMYRRALTAGATSISDPADQPYGDRTAAVRDAFGNQWYLARQLRETR